jgi:transposase
MQYTVVMSQRTFHLPSEEASMLQSAFLHCQDVHTKTRYQAVRLYGLGYAVAEIIDICACSRPSLMQWCRAYREGGVTALVDRRQGGNRARLSPLQIEAIQTQLHRYTPAQLLGRDDCQGDGQFWSVAEVACLLQRDYGVVYQSATSYQALLAKCDFSYQKPSKQYKSRNQTKVMEFEELLEKNS